MRTSQQQQLEEGEQVSLSNQSAEFITPKKAGRTNICCICRSSLAKYTCPKCSRHTCSLNCSKKHKQLRSCQGLPNPTQYMPMNKYQQENGRKDFSYLKQMIQSTDKVKKCLTGVTNRPIEPKRFTILRANARKWHNIIIHHAPTVILRHRQNISFYYVKTKQIYWVIEMSFFRKDNQFSKFVTTPTSETKTFTELITEANFLCKQLIFDGINTLKSDDFAVFLEKRNSYYRTDSKSKFIEIMTFDIGTRIRDSLTNMTLYEFPTIMFVHKSLTDKFLESRSYKIVNALSHKKQGKEQQ